jgi:hypothetical protein
MDEKRSWQREAGEYILLIPVFDDWPALSSLIPLLDHELESAAITPTLLIVDDSSNETRPVELLPPTLHAIRLVDVLELKRNLGHQRAIAIGLSYVAESRPCSGVIIMDGDGEDLPSDVPRLLRRFEETRRESVIFAKRTRRSEGFTFVVFYWFYRVIHRVLTGIRVEVGNFSVIPYQSLLKLTVVSDLWNHYAAAVIHAKLRRSLVDTSRGRRLGGRPSNMSFVSLVGHGLSAMSVFAEVIGVRMLVFTTTLILLLVLGSAAVIVVNVFTGIHMPGWTVLALTGFAILITQAAMLSIVFIFTTQMSRARSSFIPAREYKAFVHSVRRLWPTP